MTASDITYDAFLGGEIHIRQPRIGYRAGSDPVVLAAAVAAQSGQSVLELGCGVGVASLCLAHRVPGLAQAGVERQADYADLARGNAMALSVDFDVFTADLVDLPGDIRARSFDHVIANPPFFPTGSGTQSDNAGRDAALREDTPLAVWLDVAHRRLKPKGWMTMINHITRLPDILALCEGKFGSITLWPIAARPSRPADRFVMRARKSGRAPFVLLAPFVMHEGPSHRADCKDFSPLAQAILRDGAPLPWP